MRRRLAALLLALGLAAGPAAADPLAEAERAGREIRAAIERIRAAPDARNRLAAYGLAITACERALAAMRAGLRELAGRQAGLAAGLAAREATAGALVALLLRLERAPEPARLIHPGGPLAAARAAHLMSGMTPALDAELVTLQGLLVELGLVRRGFEDGRAALEEGLAALEAARAGLREALQRQTAAAPPPREDLERLGRTAASLADLARALAALPGAAEAPPGDFAAARGRLLPPVAGRRVLGFNAAGPGGLARPGLLLAAAPRALVVAPWRATLRYAGPFLDQGGIVVLEPAPGWLVVLAGLGRIDRVPGEVVEAGEPLGILGGPGPDSEEFLIAGPEAARPFAGEPLYIEIRKDGEAVDPAPWFADLPAEEGRP